MSDYKVGFGKPPKATQFKPGVTGNKAGRPPENAWSQFQKALRSKVTVRKGGKTRKITKLTAMIMRLTNSGLTEDSRTIIAILQQIDKMKPRSETVTRPVLPANRGEIVEQFKRKTIEEWVAKSRLVDFQRLKNPRRRLGGMTNDRT